MILFAIGFLMFVAGFALLVVGRFEFRGYKFSGWASRSAGVIFLLFFPLVFTYGYLRQVFDSQEWMEEQLALFHWGFGILCLGGGAFILLRSIANAGRKRKTPSVTIDSPLFADDGGSSMPTQPTMPESIPPPAKEQPKRSSRGSQGNPFDFS